MNRIKNSGFSLVEIITSVVIISIIGVLSYGTFQSYIRKLRYQNNRDKAINLVQTARINAFNQVACKDESENIKPMQKWTIKKETNGALKLKCETKDSTFKGFERSIVLENNFTIQSGEKDALGDEFTISFFSKLDLVKINDEFKTEKLRIQTKQNDYSDLYCFDRFTAVITRINPEESCK